MPSSKLAPSGELDAQHCISTVQLMNKSSCFLYALQHPHAVRGPGSVAPEREAQHHTAKAG